MEEDENLAEAVHDAAQVLNSAIMAARRGGLLADPYVESGSVEVDVSRPYKRRKPY